MNIERKSTPGVAKVAIFSDIHFGRGRNSSQKLESNMRYVDWFIGKCYDSSVDMVAFLGDWYDNRDALGVTVLNGGYDAIKKLTLNFPVMMVLGNHDANMKNSNEINSIRPFREIPNLTVVDNMPVIWEIGEKKIIMCPWNTDLDTISGRYDYAMGHFEFNGATLVSKVEENRKYGMSDIVRISPVVFTGHYHLTDRYVLKDGIIFSVGSPLELDWGDCGNTKHITILEISTGIVDNVINDISPRHVKYRWSAMNGGIDVPTPEKISGNYICMEIDEKFKFEDVRDRYNEIMKHLPVKCDIDYVYNFIQDMKIATKDGGTVSRMGKMQYVEKFISDLPEDKVCDDARKGIMELASKYYEAVASEDVLFGNTSVLEFGTMTIRNFLSFGAETVFDFRKHSGLNYVFGINRDNVFELDAAHSDDARNGVGKSSLFDALLFVLFGDTAKKILMNYLPNRKTSEPAFISLTMTIGEDRYYIESTISRHKRTSSTFKLYKNDEEISKGSVTKTREFFEKEVLGTGIDLFKNTDVLTTCNTQNFFSLGKQGRKNMTESVFRLDIFGKMLKAVRADMNNLDREICHNQTLISQIRSNIEKYELNLLNFSKQKDSVILGYRKSIADLIVSRKVMTDEVDAILKENIEISVTDETEQFHKLTEARSKLEATISSYSRQIRNLNDNKTRYRVVLDEICEKCYENVSRKLDISETEKNIEKISSDVARYTVLVEKIRKQLQVISDNQKRSQENVRRKEKNERAIISKRSMIEGVDGKVRDIRKLIEAEEVKVSPFEQMVADEKVKISNIQACLDKCYVTKRDLDILAFSFDENGAKKYVIRDMVEVFNERIHIYLKRMGSCYTCVFDDGFNCEFLTDSGPCSYENFSSGEKARINISVTLAFKDIIAGLGTTGSSIMAMDEFLDSSLDAFAINAIIQIAREHVEKYGKTVFLISHRECLNRDCMDNIIEMEKKGGFTSIVDDPMGDIFKE